MGYTPGSDIPSSVHEQGFSIFPIFDNPVCELNKNNFRRETKLANIAFVLAIFFIVQYLPYDIADFGLQ